jgi:polyphosphate kinase 2 (PPK2 family)
VNDDTTTTGKSAKPAKTAKASADQPTDDTAQPLSDTEPADASQDAVVSEVDRLRNEIKRTNRQHRKLVKRDRREEDLKPYQVELLKLQRHLEEHTDKRMIVLFEGRDAAGKGGTIRRVTRYMNEKHYRVVALGKPTEEQRTQWYLQRYVAQFPHGGEMVLFDRSWYNRAMVEPVFGFCTQKEYDDFLRGVGGFEKDLVRQGTALVKLYFSVTKEGTTAPLRTAPRRPAAAMEAVGDRPPGPGALGRLHHAQVRNAAAQPHQPHAVDGDPLGEQAQGTPQRHEGDPQRCGLRGPQPRSRLRARPGKIVLSGAHEVELMEADRLRRGKFRAEPATIPPGARCPRIACPNPTTRPSWMRLQRELVKLQEWVRTRRVCGCASSSKAATRPARAAPSSASSSAPTPAWSKW